MAEQTDGPVVVVEDRTIIYTYRWFCQLCGDHSRYFERDRAVVESGADAHRPECPKRPRPTPTTAQINEALAPLGVLVTVAGGHSPDAYYRILPLEGS
jgi:hypothetical protein